MIVETGTTTRRPGLTSAQRTLLEKRLRGQMTPEVRLPGIQRRMSFGPARLSFAQQRLWFLDQLQPGPMYNVPVAIRLRGDLNQDALSHAIHSVVARHDALRTRFVVEDGTPLQAAMEASPHHLSEIDLSLQPAGRRENYLRQLLEREAGRPFDLSRDELFRTLLISVDVNDHVLFLNQHHIISDAWSLGVFFRELAFFYNNFVTGRSFVTTEPSIQYADYAAWQHEWMQSPAMQKQLEFWKGHLAGAPHLLELPTDHARPSNQSFRGSKATRLLPKPLGDYVKQLSQAEGATLFMTLLAAFKVLLQRYTRQDDLVVGSPIAGRNRLETEGLIGFFVNTLPLRTTLSGNPTFREALKRVKQVTLDGYAHQDLPFERMVEELHPERNPSYSPLVQTMFMVQNEPATQFKLPGLAVEPISLETGTSKFDLTLSVEDRENGLFVSAEFCADLFSQATIDRMLGHFEMLLEAVAANPDRRIGELPLLTEAERNQILVKWNHTRTNYPRHRTISGLFEEQAGLTPESVALVFGEKHMSYRELNDRANRVAHFLKKNGVGPGVMVGVCLERSFEMIVALVGILKAGGAYVSLDPAYPKDRLKMMLEDARTPVLVTETKFDIGLKKAEIGNPAVIYLDKDWPAIQRESGDNVEVSGLGPESPAYVSFTSGSTGRPKGVCVPHRGVVRLVKQTNYASFGRNEVFLQLAPIAFDASTFEIWGALLNGSTVAIFPPQAPSLAELGDFIQRNGVTTLWLTAGLFHQMVEENITSLRGVRQLLAGGDVLSVAHVKRALEQLPGCQLINGYGPTENTTFTCCHRIRNTDRRSVPIGRPIANTQVYVLDPQGQPTPVGVPGELYTGGDGLALGYINQPQLTAEKFVPNPFGGDRLYRTGDLVRWMADGTIEFLGRIDTQLKIRGFRVELSEIETALNDHPAIRESAVTAHQNGAVDKKLAAYFVAEGAAPSAADLREHLRRRLPDYMVPALFVPMPALPLNANGKVDRKALPKPDASQFETGKQFVAPRDDIEAGLAKIWEEVLGVPRIGVDDHFFELGGHSLMAVRLVSRIEKTFGKKIPVTSVFQSPSVAQLAEVLRGGKSAVSDSSIVEIQPKGTKPPLFFVHGVGGGMFWGYTNLSKHLGPDQPVYAFNSRGTQGQPEFPTIREMAAHYVSDLRRLKPHGPYFLGGYCFGGVVALEMARQLHQQGETVPFVTLVNSIPPNADYDRFRFTPGSLAKFVRNLGYWAGYVLRQPPKAQRDFILWKLRASAKRLGRMFSARKQIYDFDVHEVVDLSAQPKDLQELWETHIRTLFAHRPEPFAGKVVLFRTPGYSLVCSFDEAYCWRRFAREVEVRMIPGAHESILDEPNVQLVAKNIAGILDDVRKEAR